MVVARQSTAITLAGIGEFFGRDHTTVIHAVKTIAGKPEHMDHALSIRRRMTPGC